jgi:exodeoxyribonuclease VII large subunit
LLKASSKLSVPLLAARLEHAKHRLGAARLAPSIVIGRISEQREKLASIWRLAEHLHPEKPLERGYAMVLDATGLTLTSAASARREPALTLKFADGCLDVAPVGSRASSRPKPASPPAEQPKLL